MSFDLRNYWPNPGAGTQLITQMSSVGIPKSITRRYVNTGTGTFKMDEFSNLGWLSAWHFTDTGTEILETSTDKPSGLVTYLNGKAIQWGGTQNVNDIVQRSIQITPTTGYWCYGTQKLTFTDFLSSFTNDGGLTFSNVVKVNVFQAWCSNSGCAYPSGQNIWTMDYWLAPSLGIVQIDYLTPTARRDYASTIVTTWETP